MMIANLATQECMPGMEEIVYIMADPLFLIGARLFCF